MSAIIRPSIILHYTGLLKLLPLSLQEMTQKLPFIMNTWMAQVPPHAQSQALQLNMDITTPMMMETLTQPMAHSQPRTMLPD